MKHTMQFLRVTAPAVLALSVAAYAPAARADGETIAVFTKNQTNPFFQAIRVGAELAAKQMNAKVINYIPTKPDSIPEQLSQVEDVIVKKPNAIVFIPVDYKAMTPSVEKINAAGIPVVDIVDRTSGGKFLAFVGSSDYNLGVEIGRTMTKALGGKGNVIILEGVKGALTSMDRVRGFNDALKEAPGIKLLASQPANYQRLQALQVMENLLQSYPKVDGVLAANDAMATGAIEALEGADRKAAIASINGTAEGIDAVKAGKLLATGDYGAFTQGCLGTMIAIRAIRKLPIKNEIMLKPTIITKENFKAFDVPLDQQKCPNWDAAAAM